MITFDIKMFLACDEVAFHDIPKIVRAIQHTRMIRFCMPQKISDYCK